MISRYPVILALVVVMAAVPLSTGRLVGNANNNANKANTLDAAQEELQKVNSDIYHLEVAKEDIQKAEAEIIKNLQKAQVRYNQLTDIVLDSFY